MMRRREFSCGLAMSALMAGTAGAAPAAAGKQAGAAWRAGMARIEAGTGGRLGVAMLDTGSGLALGWRENERFAMCSTFKLMLAAWMLALVDQGRERLDTRIEYGPEVLVPYSPVSGPHAGPRREGKEPGGGLTVAELCDAAVTLSDNSAANLLLARHGGPAGLTAFMRTLGDPVSRLDRNEPGLNEAAVGDERDTTTPAAMLRSMRKVMLGEALSPASRAQLVAWATGNRTGDKRLRAGVPGWRVGDKTGTAGESGTANDIGVFWPPGGAAPVLVTCYLTRATVPAAQQDAAIAEVARSVSAALGGRSRTG